MNLFFLFAIVVALFSSCPEAEASEAIPVQNISVSFDIGKNLIRGTSVIVLPEGKPADIYTGDLKIISVRRNGQPLNPEIKDGVFRVGPAGTLAIVFEGIFMEKPENKDPSAGKVIGDKGIYLTGRWYPSVKGMAFYSLKTLLPDGFHAVSEAEEVTVLDTAYGKEYSFSFPHPTDGITLIAGRYRELKETFDGTDIYGYFSPENISLAKTYFGYVKKYLKMYGKLLIPYPYKRFSIVENFLPDGYSRPTYTLLDQDAVRKPSSAETSLERELLYQWFGNFIYVDHQKGDWSEGLITYLSEQLREEQGGHGWQYRKQALTDYANYVNPKKEFPLKEFTAPIDSLSKAIGYGKGAMLFHMLKNHAGGDVFPGALKNFIKENGFREASWDDLRNTFETATGKNLEGFFDQWLSRTGVPLIIINDPKVLVLKGVPTVVFDIVQDGDPYILDLTVNIKTDKAEITEKLKVENGKETFEIPVEGNPLRMIIDGNYDIMRKLSKEEYPPVISRLLGDEKRLVLVSEEDEEKYSELMNAMKGAVVKDEYDIKDEDIKTNSLLVFGYGGPVLRRLFGGERKVGDGFSMEIRKNPLNTSKVIAIASANAKNEVDLSAGEILNYGKYSFVRFKNGKNVQKQTDVTEQGIVVGLDEPVLVIQPRKIGKINEIIQKILHKPIIYIGEQHTNYEDHKVQLKIIMSLHEKGRKFAIGMEMFQRPFQKFINDYMAGEISEREFLKNTQYFKRWQFDYNLYREIIEYARANNIPLIALNLWSEIIKKVSSEGLDSLTDVERGDIPESMDMSDEDYREKLREIFRQHQHSNTEGSNFDNFYQAQILWDETMAHSIDEFLKKNPDLQMVVLAGTGHVMYGYGIPKRTHRLNGKDYVTIVSGAGSVDEDLGDYLYLAESLPPPSALKLGVVLKEKNGKVLVDKIVPGSVAKSVGMKEDDILVSLDNWKIEDIADVKIFMLDKKRGEEITVKVMRKVFLVGYREFILNGTI